MALPQKNRAPRKALVPKSILANFSTDPTPFTGSGKGMTVLIPIRGANRNRNLDIILPYIFAQDVHPLEVLIVEEDTTSVIELGKYAAHPTVGHLFLKSQLPFNKSRVMNAGTAKATYNKICMLDVDMIIEKGFLKRIDTILDSVDVCFSIRQIYFLTELPTNSTFIHDGVTWAENAGFNCHGGIVAYNRTPFVEVGGMNEEFIGHGSEDTEFYTRANALLKVSDERFATVLHIPHPRDLAHANKNTEKYRKMRHEPLEQRVVRLKEAFNKNWGSVLAKALALQSSSPTTTPQQ